MERILVRGNTRTRLRARRVDELKLGCEAAQLARDTGRPVFLVVHGGSVSNSYGHRANTEYAVARALPDGRALVQLGRLPANKVTLGGCAGCVSEYLRVCYDGRYSAETREIVVYFAEREAQEAVRKAFEAVENDALAQVHKMS